MARFVADELMTSALCLLLFANMLGKDYANPRVLDFQALHKPEEDMYDRSKVPRMAWCVYPWKWESRILTPYRHDVGMQVVGQPARDLARHFAERYC